MQTWFERAVHPEEYSALQKAFFQDFPVNLWLWPASLSLLKKIIRTTFYCQHHVLPQELCIHIKSYISSKLEFGTWEKNVLKLGRFADMEHFPFSNDRLNLASRDGRTFLVC